MKHLTISITVAWAAVVEDTRAGMPRTRADAAAASAAPAANDSTPWLFSRVRFGSRRGDQGIRENPASRGTVTSAEVLVGPPWRISTR